MVVKQTQYFDNPTGKQEDGVFLIEAEKGKDLFTDPRGSFAESFHVGRLPGRFADLSWCKQMNTSSSDQFVFRGLHTQTGKHAQGKMVECTLGSVIDVIVDFRPDSSTFGRSMAILLKANAHTKLWVPRGFLHGFFSNETPPISSGRLIDGTEHWQPAHNQFMYMCDNEYCKESEATINPLSFFAKLPQSDIDDNMNKIRLFARHGKLTLSAKDANGMDYDETVAVIKADYEKCGRLWYRDNTKTADTEQEAPDAKTPPRKGRNAKVSAKKAR